MATDYRKNQLLVICLLFVCLFLPNAHGQQPVSGESFAESRDSEEVISGLSGTSASGTGDTTGAVSFFRDDLPPDDPSLDAENELKKFNELIDQWKKQIQDLNENAIRYQNGDESEATELRKQRRELEAEAREQFDKTFHQALKIVKGAPRASFDVVQFLTFSIHYRFNRDWYEGTGEAAELLMRITTQGRGLPEVAGISFFATNQPERARPYLEEAVRMGLLDEKSMGVLESLDQAARDWEREKSIRQQEEARGDLPRVRVATTRGEFVLELYEDSAPNTVANFLTLVEEGVYRGVPFYQVIDGQLALAGDTRIDPISADFWLADEVPDGQPRGLFRGSISMAKAPVPEAQPDGLQFIPNSASTHFFISMRPFVVKRSEHVVFGRIVEGIEHFTALTRIDPSKEKEEGEIAKEPDLILEMEVIRKRDHQYTPQRILRSSLVPTDASR